MAGGDKRGPRGMGPMTGRGLGYCAGYDRPGYQADAAPAGGGYVRGQGYGHGYGQGFRHGAGRGYGPGPARGFGRGFRWNQAYNETPVDMAAPLGQDTLADEIAGLRAQIADLEARLSERHNKD